MQKVNINLLVDINKLREITNDNESSIYELVEQELNGWLEQSRIKVIGACSCSTHFNQN